VTAPSSLRVCTFNVHGFGDAQGRSRLQETIAVLGALACDVLVLNEVLAFNGALERLADALGMHASYGAAGYGGNAILLREKPRAVENVPLTVHGRELRTALCAELIGPAGPLVIAATHLDDRSEDARCAQLTVLRAHLSRASTPHVMAGDFNAVRTADYAPARLLEIAKLRAKNAREPPRDDVAFMMDGWGYVDAARLAHAGDSARYAQSLTTPLPEGLAVTCWVGTRIDQVWLDARAAAQLTCAHARVVETDVSDHRPVVVELAAR
jgi:endonuclease/exonuclease/phosphatase family metal-dependent hydrolase